MKKLLCSLLLAALLTVTALGAEVRVAVIDTGVRPRPELLAADKILPGRNYVQDSDHTTDVVGHGTRIAGLILGTRDGTIQSPCRETLVVPLVYYTKLATGAVQNGGVEGICQAIYDAVDQYDCRIINLSSGVTGESEQLRKAVDYAESKGVLIVASAGNDSDALTYPAAWDTVLAVGSHDETGEKSAFSAAGPGLSLLASGEQVQTVSIRNARDYEIVSGTSYAAARVTAQAAALLEQYPQRTVRELRYLLQTGCRDVGAPGWDEETGWGVLDEEQLWDRAALLEAGELVCYLDVPPESPWFDAVQQTEALGLMQGTGPGEFSPDQPVTRAEIAVILHRLAGMPAAGNCPCTDVAAEAWYAPAAAWAVETGILPERGRGVFEPRDFVTGPQLRKILQRYGAILDPEIQPGPQKAGILRRGDVARSIAEFALQISE